MYEHFKMAHNLHVMFKALLCFGSFPFFVLSFKESQSFAYFTLCLRSVKYLHKVSHFERPFLKRMCKDNS